MRAPPPPTFSRVTFTVAHDFTPSVIHIPETKTTTDGCYERTSDSLSCSISVLLLGLSETTQRRSCSFITGNGTWSGEACFSFQVLAYPYPAFAVSFLYRGDECFSAPRASTSHPPPHTPSSKNYSPLQPHEETKKRNFSHRLPYIGKFSSEFFVPIVPICLKYKIVAKLF